MSNDCCGFSSDGDCALVKKLMNQLEEKHHMEIPVHVLSKVCFINCYCKSFGSILLNFYCCFVIV